MPEWILLSFLSALGLGVYDALKKNAVHGNSATRISHPFDSFFRVFFCQNCRRDA
jgi:hypothetical protein